MPLDAAEISFSDVLADLAYSCTKEAALLHGRVEQELEQALGGLDFDQMLAEAQAAIGHGLPPCTRLPADLGDAKGSGLPPLPSTTKPNEWHDHHGDQAAQHLLSQHYVAEYACQPAPAIPTAVERTPIWHDCQGHNTCCRWCK
jgi:hypothetical protein